MHKKTHKTKFLPSTSKKKKIGGMQRRKYIPPSRSTDDKSGQIKLAEETAAMWNRRAADIKAGKFESAPSEGGLKRGPKPDLSRSEEDKCTKTVTTALTPREFRMFEKMRVRYPFAPTVSQFLRTCMRCAFGKSMPTLPREALDELDKDNEFMFFRLNDEL
jgi:hypothetical protein